MRGDQGPVEQLGRPGHPSPDRHGHGQAAVPHWPLRLGWAGLLPQLACAAAVWAGPPEWRYAALAIAWGYAALILSFLGGLWWGLAAAADHRHEPVPTSLWIAAVAPSLLALATYLPWVFGLQWPGPSLVVLALALAASPLVDRRLARHHAPRWWMRLRWPLSEGLAAATLLVALS
ncbi:DUF3429 domain-containing protein [Qipengyuania thermophila]|uniref:DUF3429 domain-containing protein n=1 Tax=Qipengyuania thermophila TaxID=2509361 RepID=UPI001F2B55FF|nr:DUF3429 domain-containing protein [Qipengyuania thermophila]